MQTKFKPTGRTFSSVEVAFGHKRGVFCLMCGIFTGGLACETCKDFKKCELCGIVCKEQPTNKIFMYGRDIGNKKISVELFQEVKTICQILDDGLCEDCVNWVDRIKNRCICCGEKFENSYKHFKESGNYCSQCMKDIIFNMRFNEKDPRYQRFKRQPLIS